MLPFPSQNPYGGYFGFNEEVYSQSAGLPEVPMGFAPGLMSAMGKPVGGFNPTSSEFRAYRSRDIAYQQFMSRSLQMDQRAASVTHAFLESMSKGASRELQERMGGRANMNALASFGLNMPGIAEYIGGSQRSIAFGSLAAASGGLGMSGVPTFGQDPLHLMFAEQLQRQVMSRYIQPSGAMNLSASQGLNRDQLGGIMALASSQGAFAGLDMGKLDSADQKAKLISNPDTINKIDRFLSNSAKALGNLMDIYGKLSTSELAAKAQQITGLDFSRLGNPEIIQQRLNSLRTTAEATGVDYQTMFEMSARSGDMARAYGLPGGFGSFVAQESMYTARLRQSDRNTAGFYFAQPDVVDDQNRRMRDLAGMSRDPYGARMAALELMMQNKGIAGAEAAGIRSQFSGKPSTQGSIGELDQFIQQRFGMSAPGFIQGMGGPMGVLQNIAPERQLALTNAMNEQFRSRQEVQIERMAMHMGLSGGARAGAMKLFTTMSSGNLDALLNGGNAAELFAADYGARNNIPGMTGALSDFMAGGGTMDKMRALRQAQMQNPLTSGFQSVADRQRSAEMRLYSATFRAKEYGDFANLRGQYNGGQLGEAFWSQMGGTDTASMLNVMAVLHPESVFGFGSGKGFRLNRGEWLSKGLVNSTAGGLQFTGEGWKQWHAEASRMQSAFGTSPEGKMFLEANGLGGKLTDAALLRSFSSLTDPTSLFETMSGAGLGGMLEKSTGRVGMHSLAGLDRMKQSAPLRSLIAALGGAKEMQYHGLFSDDVGGFNQDQMRKKELSLLSAQLDGDRAHRDPAFRQKTEERINMLLSQSFTSAIVSGPDKSFKALMDKKFSFSPELGAMIAESLSDELGKIDRGEGPYKNMIQSKRDKERDQIVARRNQLQIDKGLGLEEGQSVIQGTLELKGSALQLMGTLMKGKSVSGEEMVGKH